MKKVIIVNPSKSALALIATLKIGKDYDDLRVVLSGRQPKESAIRQPKVTQPASVADAIKVSFKGSRRFRLADAKEAVANAGFNRLSTPAALQRMVAAKEARKVGRGLYRV